jgi:hypothetical protein
MKRELWLQRKKALLSLFRLGSRRAKDPLTGHIQGTETIAPSRITQLRALHVEIYSSASSALKRACLLTAG